ncbi:hypothetical protein BC940DRAFT_317059 [Gongronella butleri]|nr:hypothetical protein BC940DRAFT_317059 [Gongronella butleri]
MESVVGPVDASFQEDFEGQVPVTVSNMDQFGPMSSYSARHLERGIGQAKKSIRSTRLPDDVNAKNNVIFYKAARSHMYSITTTSRPQQHYVASSSHPLELLSLEDDHHEPDAEDFELNLLVDPPPIPVLDAQDPDVIYTFGPNTIGRREAGAIISLFKDAQTSKRRIGIPVLYH